MERITTMLQIVIKRTSVTIILIVIKNVHTEAIEDDDHIGKLSSDNIHLKEIITKESFYVMNY